MPLCPTCRSEYRAGVTHCADDGTALVETLPPDDAFHGVLAEAYAVFNDVEADRLRAMLEDVGIPCYLRRLRRAAFPTEGGSEAQTRVAVPHDMVEKAAALIRQARDDEMVSATGFFLR